MSLPRFFLEEQVVARETEEVFELRLSDEDAKHARVLRLQPGEHIAVIDASSDYFEVEIVQAEKQGMLVRIAQHVDVVKPLASVELFQGLAKGEKMETVIRHATELGVSRFVPFAAKRSVMKLDAKKASSKIARWASIAKSAAMQSGQNSLAEVCMPVTVKQLCASFGEYDAVLVCWEEAEGTCSLPLALAEVKDQMAAGVPQRIAVVVGPEGGIDAEEVQQMLGSAPCVKLVSLGSSILRTETAGIVAPALALYELGGLGRQTAGR